jgi:hypothetical protein
MYNVHLARQALKKVLKKQKEVAEKIKGEVVDNQKFNDLIQELDLSGYKSIVDTLEDFEHDIISFMQFSRSTGVK